LSSKRVIPNNKKDMKNFCQKYSFLEYFEVSCKYGTHLNSSFNYLFSYMKLYYNNMIKNNYIINKFYDIKIFYEEYSYIYNIKINIKENYF
jgi:hypothetical protein